MVVCMPTAEFENSTLGSMERVSQNQYFHRFPVFCRFARHPCAASRGDCVLFLSCMYRREVELAFAPIGTVTATNRFSQPSEFCSHWAVDSQRHFVC